MMASRGAANSQRSDIRFLMMTSQKSNCRCRDGVLTWALDDYLTKPFEIEELFARIRVIERRLQRGSPTAKEPTNQLVVGELMMDIANTWSRLPERPLN